MPPQSDILNLSSTVDNTIATIRKKLDNMDDYQCEALNFIFELSFSKSTTYNYRQDDRLTSKSNMINMLEFMHERSKGNYEAVVLLNSILWAVRAIDSYHKILDREGVGEMVVL